MKISADCGRSWENPKDPYSHFPAEQTVELAVVTHLHPDHYDPGALRKCLAPSGKVVCHRDVREKISADGLAVHALDLEEPFIHKDVKLTAVPAVDGFGDPQVSWVIEGGGRKSSTAAILSGTGIGGEFAVSMARSTLPFFASTVQ